MFIKLNATNTQKSSFSKFWPESWGWTFTFTFIYYAWKLNFFWNLNLFSFKENKKIYSTSKVNFFGKDKLHANR